jgi:hypothetical protein
MNAVRLQALHTTLQNYAHHSTSCSTGGRELFPSVGSTTKGTRNMRAEKPAMAMQEQRKEV